MFQPSEKPIISSNATPTRLARAVVATNDKARITGVMEQVLFQCRTSGAALPFLHFVHSVLVVLLFFPFSAEMM
jgi:hypothetical protein